MIFVNFFIFHFLLNIFFFFFSFFFSFFISYIFFFHLDNIFCPVVSFVVHRSFDLIFCNSLQFINSTLVLSDNFLSDFFFILPECFLFFSLFFFFCSILFCANFFINFFFLILIFILYFFLLLNQPADFLLFFFPLQSTTFIYYSKFLCLFLFFSILSVIYQEFQFNRSYSSEFLYFFGILFFTINVLIMTSEFLLFFLLLELQTMIFILFLGINKFNLKSLEASLKFFFLGAFSGLLFLLGFIFIFFSCGSTAFSDIYLYSQFLNYLPNLNLKVFYQEFMYYDLDNFFLSINTSHLRLFWGGFFLIFISLFFKLAIIGFHQWMPDIYDGSSIAITMCFATISKFLSIILFFNLLLISGFFLVHYFFFFKIGYIILFGSLLLGVFNNFYQQNVKRILAFGSISQMSYLFLSLYIGTIGSISIFFLYFIFYLLNSAGAFLLLSSLRRISSGKLILQIQEFGLLLNSVSYSIPFSFIFFLFSFAGLPPLLSFFFKFGLILEFFLVINHVNFIYIFFFFFFSSLSSFYYLRLIRFIISETSRTSIFEFIGISWWKLFFLIFILFNNFFFFIFPETYFFFFYYLVSSLLLVCNV